MNRIPTRRTELSIPETALAAQFRWDSSDLDIRLPSSSLPFFSSVQAVVRIGLRNRSISPRMLRNRSRGTATSAIWNVT